MPINVGISDWKISSNSEALVTYALGSCVGICMYDKKKPVGGLSHIMLPDSSSSVDKASINRMKFADTAIPDMYAQLIKNGASANTIVAKIAGGALMFATNAERFNIGERNIAAVKVALSKIKVPIIASDIGQNYGRTVYFYPANGIVEIRSTLRGINRI